MEWLAEQKWLVEEWLRDQRWGAEQWLFEHRAQIDAVWRFIAERRYVLMLLITLGMLWCIRRAKRLGWI